MSRQLVGCPSCGLFLHHVEGCRGVVAVYLRYHARGEEDGFHSVDEAVRWIYGMEEMGSLAGESVQLGDGTVLLDGAGLDAAEQALERKIWPA